MKHTIVTSFGVDGYQEYAYKFLDTYNKYFNAEFELIVYHEGTVLDDSIYTKFNLLEIDNCFEFIRRHEDNKVISGSKKSPDHRWKDKCIRESYNFRFDANKFCRKIFAIEHAANYIGEGKLYWIDADVVFFKKLDKDFLNKVLPDNYDISYLKRWDYYHSECGFVGYNLDRSGCRDFIMKFADKYSKDTFVGYKEWHDSYIFDQIRKETKVKAFPIKSKNMHKVFDTSVLGEYMMHLKGDLKSVKVSY